MIFLVVADTHGNTLRLSRIVQENLENIDGIIHLGDFSQDIQNISLPDNLLKFTCIGNMDGIERLPSRYEDLINIQGYSILMTHSDHLETHYNLNRLYLKSQELGVDLCLFGHTHKPYMDSSKKPYLFNPGSLGKPISGLNPSYGILELAKNKINFILKEIKR